jgi:hypothetical protein
LKAENPSGEFIILIVLLAVKLVNLPDTVGPGRWAIGVDSEAFFVIDLPEGFVYIGFIG